MFLRTFLSSVYAKDVVYQTATGVPQKLPTTAKYVETTMSLISHAHALLAGSLPKDAVTRVALGARQVQHITAKCARPLM